MRAAVRAACIVLLLSASAGGAPAPRAALANDGADGALALASPLGLLDLVPALPGLPASALKGASQTYAGYVAIPGTSRALYYALQLSEHNPAKDPLILWLKLQQHRRGLPVGARSVPVPPQPPAQPQQPATPPLPSRAAAAATVLALEAAAAAARREWMTWLAQTDAATAGGTERAAPLPLLAPGEKGPWTPQPRASSAALAARCAAVAAALGD